MAGTYSLDQKGEQSDKSGAGALAQSAANSRAGNWGIINNIATGGSKLTSSADASSDAKASASATSGELPTWIWWIIGGVALAGFYFMRKRRK